MLPVDRTTSAITPRSGCLLTGLWRRGAAWSGPSCRRRGGGAWRHLGRSGCGAGCPWLVKADQAPLKGVTLLHGAVSSASYRLIRLGHTRADHEAESRRVCGNVRVLQRVWFRRPDLPVSY